MPQPLAPVLDRSVMVTSAFAQLEEEGLDGLSMRRLAARMGVQAPALYWHIGDKAELLGLMARDIYARAYAGVPAAGDWRGWLVGFGRSLRRVFASIRDSARLCALARPPAAADVASHARSISAPLLALGLDLDTALSCQASVISLTLGWASFEANGPMHDYLEEMFDFDASFEAGLAALVAGFEGV